MIGWSEAAVAGLLVVLMVALADLAHRFRSLERAHRVLARLADRQVPFGLGMGGVLGGVIVVSEADAVRLDAHLPPLDPGYRLAILAGYLVLAAGVAVVHGTLVWGDG